MWGQGRAHGVLIFSPRVSLEVICYQTNLPMFQEHKLPTRPDPVRVHLIPLTSSEDLMKVWATPSPPEHFREVLCFVYSFRIQAGRMAPRMRSLPYFISGVGGAC